MHRNQMVNPLLLEERQKCTFPLELMTNALDGSAEETSSRRHIEQLVVDDEDMQFPVMEFLSREEQYNLAVRKHSMAIQKLKEHGVNDHVMAFHYGKMIANHESSPFGVHFIMFIPAFLSQADPQQQETWLPKALNYEIFGTYAQTELAHGTYIRGLQTTAHYDPQKEEFILHTPSIEATKWWPGNLGKTANYALVVAQMYSRDHCYGLHYFLVQLRDLNTHEVLPGIHVGDIGPKMGFSSNDNGFLQLTHVRVPRNHMLSKNAEVLPNGDYISKRDQTDKLSYGTMLLVRSMLVHSVGTALAEAVTIATRYSAIRLQGYANSENAPTGGRPETKLLDYPTQQLKLVTELCHSYAYTLVGKELRQLFFSVQSEIEGGMIDRLPRLHALSAGLKAISTWDASFGIEHMRMACGGHGYSLASGLPQIYSDTVASCTYEGDNTVLLLQTAKYLLKTFSKNSSLSESRGSLNLNPDLASLLKAHEKRAYTLHERMHLEALKFSQNGEVVDSFYQKYAVELVACAVANCRALVCDMFYKSVQTVDPLLKPVLLQLVAFYALHWILQDTGSFVQCGCFDENDIGKITESVKQLYEYRKNLLALLRPNLVGLVDAFDFHDRILNSVLGRYDGQVYSNLLQWAKKSPLNESDILPSFHSFLLPLMRGEKIAPNKAKL